MKHCQSCPSRMNGVFCELGAKDLDALSLAKTTNHYKKGQIIFYEGATPTGLFCISNGKVKLLKEGEQGKEALLRILGPGAILGARGVMTGKNYSVTAQALEDSSICFVDKEFIKNMISTNATLATKVLIRLSEELTQAENSMADLMNQNVQKRMGHLVLSLDAIYGKTQGNKRLIDIALTRSDMAAMIGTTPETVMRILSEYREMGFVEQEGKKMFLSDKEGLIESIDGFDQ